MILNAIRSAINYAHKHELSQMKHIARLSTGLRVDRAADDAAGLAISLNMSARLRRLHQAQRNAQDGVSLSQIADAALGSMLEHLQRIRELTIASDVFEFCDVNTNN